MRVLNVEFRDIHVTLEFSLKQLQYIRDLFDHADIEYDGEKEPEMKEAINYLQNQLHPFLVQIIKDNEGNMGG